jgi:hypothetical protein
MKSAAAEIGRDALVEDIFGLNLRGLATIRDAFIRPQRVAGAARSIDFLGVYTPPIRVLFFLLTLTSILRFLWGDENGFFAQMLAEQIAAVDEEKKLSRENIELAVNTHLASYAAALPFTWLAAQGFAAYVLKLWGRGVGYVLRLRLHMLTLIPSMVLGLFTLIAMAAIGERSGATAYLMISALSMLIIAATDFVTAARLLPATTFSRRLGKAALFSVVVQVLTIISSTATSAGASFIAFETVLGS